jgi:hypothetical protein
MRRFLRRQCERLTRDDLFVRVVSLLMGLVVGGIGVAMAAAAAPQDFRAWLGWFNLLWWPAALLLVAWGALLLSRSVVPARWRAARLAEKALLDAGSLEDAAALLLVFIVPAALLTLLLRLAGIRGQSIPPDGLTLFGGERPRG